MRRMKILGTMVAAGVLAACSSSSDGGGGTPYNGFVRPPGTIAVNFKVDDSANKVYTAGDLEWKGGWSYNAGTRIATRDDATWAGPYPMLYDDGPWTVATTAHETATSTAGDHIWSVTMFVTPPATGSQQWNYGLNDVYYQAQFGNGWIWPGANGSFTVTAGQTTDIDAPGLVIGAFGDRDLRLTIDTSAMDATYVWSTAHVGVKGTATAWGVANITANKVGTVYTFTLSDFVGAGKPFKHTGLIHGGTDSEFIFTFDGMMTGSLTTSCCDVGCGSTAPCEYKVHGQASAEGVTAATKLPTSATYDPAVIGTKSGGMSSINTYIAVP